MNPDAMDTQGPVEGVVAVFEVGQEGHPGRTWFSARRGKAQVKFTSDAPALKVGHLVEADGIEPVVVQSPARR